MYRSPVLNIMRDPRWGRNQVHYHIKLLHFIMYILGDIWGRPLVIWLFSTRLCHWTTGRYELNTFITLLLLFHFR